MMTECERLVELIKGAKNRAKDGNCDLERNMLFADHLLRNGVIVAPMPMADWLREELTEYVHKRCVEEL